MAWNETTKKKKQKKTAKYSQEARGERREVKGNGQEAIGDIREFPFACFLHRYTNLCLLNAHHLLSPCYNEIRCLLFSAHHQHVNKNYHRFSLYISVHHRMLLLLCCCFGVIVSVKHRILWPTIQPK